LTPETLLAVTVTVAELPASLTEPAIDKLMLPSAGERVTGELRVEIPELGSDTMTTAGDDKVGILTSPVQMEFKKAAVVPGAKGRTERLSSRRLGL
jgi:hypothetical protein